MGSSGGSRAAGLKGFIICLSAVLLMVCGYGIAGLIKREGKMQLLGKEYEINIAGTAPSLYPTVIKAGLLWYSKEEALKVPPSFPFSGEWGAAVNSSILGLREEFPMPTGINLLWLSLAECKCYYLAADLKPEMEEIWKNAVDENGEYLFSHIVVGMAPYGQVALWMSGSMKAVLVDWMKGKEAPEVAGRFVPEDMDMTLQEYCNSYIGDNQAVQENLKNCGLPPQNLFDGYMQQFRYRYIVRFENWDEQGFKDSKGCLVHWAKPEMEEGKPSFELSYLGEFLYDGTFDKLHDGRLLSYHIAGKPRKLRVDWHLEKSEYSAFFWIDDKVITDVFRDFYGPHRDTDTDFMIRIDPEKKKYELSLYRYGLRQPVLIPEDACQILVFKNKFENFRSENYSQKRGAWIW